METVNRHQFSLECEKFPSDKREKIVLTDKGKSEYRANNINKKMTTAMIVDGCLIKEGARCDYLLLVCNDSECDKKDAYFIELKGSDIMKAISQIDRSIDELKGNLKGFERIFARIVPTRISVPDLRNKPPYISLNKKLKELNGNLVCQVKLIDKI